MSKKYNEKKVELKEGTKFFPANERMKALEYANSKRSYIADAYNEKREWIGYYVPN